MQPGTTCLVNEVMMKLDAPMPGAALVGGSSMAERVVSAVGTLPQALPQHGAIDALPSVETAVPLAEPADALSNWSASGLLQVAHDMRGPLHAITIAAELLLTDEGVLTSQDTRGQVNSIYRGAVWLQGLLENLLYAERLRTHQVAPSKRPVDLSDLVAECAQVVRPLLDSRHQSLALDLPPSLPRTLGDARRLAQVLMNLILNASKFSGTDTPIDVTAEHITKEDGHAIRLSVADRGPGLPPDHERLFAPFVRGADASNVRSDGLGLGLAIAYEIVRSHSGQIGAANRSGGGSLFWFEVPAIVSLTGERISPPRVRPTRIRRK